MKKAYWAGAALILAFLVLGLTTFSSSMTPYVSFDEAQKSPRTVQVMGGLEKGSARYDTTSKTLFFNLVDLESKKVLPVAYRDVKPANFEDAVSIVAIGKYGNGGFQAEKLLVKCPSKYQGQETEKHYGAKVSVRS
jgi:cytochrome c-type biogenesis protein CcmE